MNELKVTTYQPKIEYKLRQITRYIITRYEENSPESKGSSVQIGSEYANEYIAYEVAYALCKSEHERLGYAPGDERIIYPESTIPAPNDCFFPKAR